MANVGNVNVRITADTASMQSNLKNAQGSMSNFESSATKSLGTIQKAFIAFSLAAAAALAIVAKKSIEAAMDVVESESLFTVSMGNMADSARAWSEDMQSSMGLNAFEIRKSVGVLYNMTTSMGLAGDKAYELSKGVTELAYDMASFYNITNDDALLKLRSGLTGESEPLKALGIIVNETTTQMYAYQNGIAAVGAQLTEQQKVMARYGVIMAATKNAQGDLARTIMSPTNQLRLLTTQLQITMINLGQAFLPIVSIVIPILVSFAKTLVYVSGLFASFMKSLFGIETAQTNVAASTNSMGVSMGGLGATTKQIDDSTKSAADSTEGLGKATKKAGKDAKKGVQGFDEVNQISEDIASSAADAAGAVGGMDVGGGGAVGAIAAPTMGAMDSSPLDKATEKMNLLKEAFSSFYKDWGVKDLFEGIKKGVSSIDFTTFQTNLLMLGTMMTNSAIMLMPVAQLAYQALGSAIGLAIGTGIATTASVITGIVSGIVLSIPLFFSQLDLSSIITNFTTIFSSIAGIITATMPSAVAEATALGETIGTAISGAVAVTLTLFAGITGGIAQFFADNTPIIINFVTEIQNNMTAAFTSISETLTLIFGIILTVMNSNMPLIHGVVSNIALALTTLAGVTGKVVSDMIKIVFEAINKFVEDNKVAIQTAFDNVVNIFSMALNLISTVSTDILNSIQAFWDTWGANIFGGIIGVFTDIANWFMIFYNETLAPIFREALVILQELWDNHLKAVVDQVLGFVGRLGEAALMIYNNFIKPLVDFFVKNLLPPITATIKTLMSIIGGIVGTIGDVIGGIFKILNGIIDFVVGVFTGNWQKAWDGIKGIFTGIWDVIVSVFKGVVNTLVKGINFLIRGVNKIGFDVPAIPGVSEAFHFGFNIPEIPLMEKGGIVSSPTMAMIGENGTEAVVPLENTSFIDTLASAIGSAVLNAMQFATPTSNTQAAGDVIINIDGTEMARVMLPNLQTEQFRIGNRAILQGV